MIFSYWFIFLMLWEDSEGSYKFWRPYNSNHFIFTISVSVTKCLLCGHNPLMHPLLLICCRKQTRLWPSRNSKTAKVSIHGDIYLLMLKIFQTGMNFISLFLFGIIWKKEKQIKLVWKILCKVKIHAGGTKI